MHLPQGLGAFAPPCIGVTARLFVSSAYCLIYKKVGFAEQVPMQHDLRTQPD